jgi:ribosomal protein L7/L12
MLLKHANISLDEYAKLASLVETKLFTGTENNADEILGLMTLLDNLRETIGEKLTPCGCAVTLLDYGKNKIAVIKEIRTAIPGCGLKEAKDISESLPKAILQNVPYPQAKALADKFEAVGAKYRLDLPIVEHHQLHRDNSDRDEE